jgi:competence protein ComEC
VLCVANAGGTALLTGDMKKETEVEMVKTQPGKLANDVLVVPHHRCNTSSTTPFLRAVRPMLALVSAGYKNRYDFPTCEVRARYRRQGIPLRNTGSNGALNLDVQLATGVRLREGY